MIALAAFAVLSLGTLFVLAITSEQHHQDRWSLNAAKPCCDERAAHYGVPAQATTNFASANSSARSFVEFDRDDIAA